MNRAGSAEDQPLADGFTSIEEQMGGESTRDVAGGEPPSAVRALLLLAAFMVLSVIVVARLFAYQMPENGSVGGVAAASSGETARGRILDTNNVLLATDTFEWEVYARPEGLENSPDGYRLTTGLAEILDRSEESLSAEFDAATPELAIVDRTATESQCAAIQDLGNLNLIWCIPRRSRVYPMDSLGASVIGFATANQVGATGIERTYDAWLRKTAEWPDSRLPNSRAEPMPASWKLYLPSPIGRDLVLYLNAALQNMVEERLAEAVDYYGAESGTIVIMDPKTGGILALANMPTFDPNNYGEAPEELWGNPAVRDAYEPGSVFKLITYAAALDTEKITPETVFEDDGSLVVSGRTINNAEDQAYGQVTAEEALAKSINVVAAQMCLDMGSETFYRYVRQFGFSKPTEVDLNGESEGIVKSPGNRYWSQYDQAANSFGQGISVTALQLVDAVAAIANDGTLLQPQAARAFVLNGKVYPVPSRMMRQAIRPETAKTLTRMMVYNVESSSNPSLVPGFRVAGKTGTAEIPTETGYTSDETITSFVAFLPAADPKLVILVKLAKPQLSTWAERVVVPVFAEVAIDATQILGIQPNSEMP